MEKLRSAAFTSFIGRGTRVVLVGATWSTPARAMYDVLASIEPVLDPSVQVGTLDADAEPVLAGTLARAVPAAVVFVDGHPVHVIVGQLSVEAFTAALRTAGVPFKMAAASAAAPQRVLPRFSEMRAAMLAAAATPDAHHAPLADFIARASQAAQVDRDSLAAMIRNQSWAAVYGTTTEVEQCIDAALAALRGLPALIAELETTALDEKSRPVGRLGALAGLMYGAARFDGLSDDLPGSYGYLDDWLVLSSAKWIYVRAPGTEEMDLLAQAARLVWSCLPPALLPSLIPFVGRMEYERAALEQAPEAQVRAILDSQLQRPAPFQFVVPATQAQSQAANGMRDPMGGWSVTSSGSQWGDGRAMGIRFAGGGSVGLTSSDKIVGGP